ncbi:hypothetical protein K0M31_011279 [Melipona bicolor]|uniref:Uncharacterized protein n=1 Tax=Melipona bicolor TaxID=60889 RepID=A0AA40G9G2_9HYME|nr:hypothetical protein K0M31_011279 [Melipona bicolor]
MLNVLTIGNNVSRQCLLYAHSLKSFLESMDRFNVNITRSHVTATKVFEDGAYEPAFTRATAFIEKAHARTPPKGFKSETSRSFSVARCTHEEPNHQKKQ